LASICQYGGFVTRSAEEPTFTDLFRVGDLTGFDLVVEQQVSGILGDFARDFSGAAPKGPAPGVVTPEPNTALMALTALAAGVGGMCLRGLARRTRTFTTA
jgi:hypothetical protein